MATAFDDFSGYSDGALATVGSANWTVVTLTGEWTVTVGSTSGPSSEPACVWDNGITGDNNAHARYSSVAATSGDIECYSTVYVGASYDPNVAIGPAIMQSDNACYALASNTGGQTRLLRFSAGGGASSVIGTATFTLSASTLYHFIVGRTGTTIYGYVWADGGSQSGSPDMSGTDTVLGTIGPAIFCRDSSMTPLTVTKFGVGTGGDAAPQSGGGGGPTAEVSQGLHGLDQGWQANQASRLGGWLQ